MRWALVNKHFELQAIFMFFSFVDVPSVPISAKILSLRRSKRQILDPNVTPPLQKNLPKTFIFSPAQILLSKNRSCDGDIVTTQTWQSDLEFCHLVFTCLSMFFSLSYDSCFFRYLGKFKQQRGSSSISERYTTR